MVEREPIAAKNLDGYGGPEIPWQTVRDALIAETPRMESAFFLGTVNPDGKPQSAGIGALWHNGDLYIASGPGTRKSKNLAANPHCTIAGRITGFDVVMEGEAHRVTDHETLVTIAKRYADSGWPAEATDDALTAPYSAQSAGPPPWYLYRFVFDSVVTLRLGEPGGAMKWSF